MSEGQAYKSSKETGLSVIKDGTTFLKFFKVMVFLVVWAGSIPVEVFIHRGFGVRYLTIFTVSAGAAAAFAPILFAEEGAHRIIASLTFAAYLALCLLHTISAWRRDHRKVRWHSRSGGEPYPFWKSLPLGEDPYKVVRYHEPICVFVLGMVIVPFSVVGVLILGSAVALFIKGLIEDWHIRGAILDQIDQQIEGEAMAQLVEGTRDNWDGEGFIVPPVAARAVSTGLSVAEAAARVEERQAEVKPMGASANAGVSQMTGGE